MRNILVTCLLAFGAIHEVVGQSAPLKKINSLEAVIVIGRDDPDYNHCEPGTRYVIGSTVNDFHFQSVFKEKVLKDYDVLVVQTKDGKTLRTYRDPIHAIEEYLPGGEVELFYEAKGVKDGEDRFLMLFCRPKATKAL